MKWRFVGLILVIFITCISTTLYVKEPIKFIARVHDWPPYYYQVDGEWHGVSVDAYKALADEAGIQITFKEIPWTRALKYLKSRPILLSNLTFTEERAEYIHFIGPHYFEKMRLVLPIEYKNVRIESLEDLAALAKSSEKKIVYQQDVFYSVEFNNRIATEKSFARLCKKKAQMLKESIQMIAEDKYLAYIDDITSILYQIKLHNLSDKVTIHEFPISESAVYIGVSKALPPGMIERLKNADEQLKKKGVYKKIQEKWSNLK